MAYPTISGFYGLKPVNLVGGRVYSGSTRMIPIKEAYATSMFNGDVVQLAAGLLNYSAATAATPAVVAGTIGVFVGAEYSTTAGPIYGKNRWQYWQGATIAQDAVGYVVDDPQAVFKAAIGVQPVTTAINTCATNGYISPSFVGTNLSLVTGNTGSTATGDSAMCLTGIAPTVSSTVSGNLRTTGASPFRVVQLVSETAVSVSTVVGTGSSAATTFTASAGLAISPGMQVVYNVTGSGAMPGDYATVTGYVTSTGVVTTAANTTIPTGATVTFVGYAEAYVTWNFGYHSYMNATGV